MIKNKKLALLSVAGLLGALAIGVTATSGSGIIRTNGDDATVWKHYAAVAATETTYGSKEFWASCTADVDGNYGTRVFTAPTTGTIKEGGDFSATTYFAEMTADDDRYVAPLDSTITFDARGGAAVDEGKYSYGTLASALPTTTRAADNYYESYEFGGWYKDGVAYDKVAGSTTVKANWKYGNAKKVYVNEWTSNLFTTTLDTKIKNVAFINSSSYSGTFNHTDNDGIAFVPGNASDTIGTITAPAIDFASLLENNRAIYMYVGCYNKYNKLYVDAGGKETKISYTYDGINDETQDKSLLTRTLLRFVKENDGKVHIHYSDVLAEKPRFQNDRNGDVTLSDDQANGTKGLVFRSGIQGATRLYWLGKPYYISGEEKFMDLSQKPTGLAVTNGEIRNRTEANAASSAPWSQWYECVGGLNEYIGVYGNTYGESSVLTLPTVDFSAQFTVGKGIRFTVGSWNTNEHIYCNGVDLGVEIATAGKGADRTKDEFEKTWHNWEISIDDIGVHAYNKNEDKTYDVALTDAQLSGKEGISLQLTTGNASDRFFLLSNLYTYHF